MFDFLKKLFGFGSEKVNDQITDSVTAAPYKVETPAVAQPAEVKPAPKAELAPAVKQEQKQPAAMTAPKAAPKKKPAGQKPAGQKPAQTKPAQPKQGAGKPRGRRPKSKA